MYHVLCAAVVGTLLQLPLPTTRETIHEDEEIA